MACIRSLPETAGPCPHSIANLYALPKSYSLWTGTSLVDQAVELAGILAGHLEGGFGRQMAELLFDVFLRFRPHAIRVRIVRTPHQRLYPHLLDQLGADAVELQRRLALAAPVFAWQRLELEVLVLVLVLEIHAVEHVGDPADAALAQHDADIGEALEHRR